MASLTATLDELARQFTEIHGRKEDLFWATKMGLRSDVDAARNEMAEAEKAWNRFAQDPALLARLRSLEGQARTEPERKNLGGWITFISAHVIEDPAARKLSEELVEREAELQRARGAMRLGYLDPKEGAFVPASSVKLSLMLRTDPDEARRRAAFDGLRSIEPLVLASGFLDIVKLRNRLGRMLGFEDYYAWRVAVVERMTKARLFDVLDDLAARTAARAGEELAAFARKHGARALDPWNFGYLRSGKLMEAMDPYFAFSASLERWGRSFAALGVDYRGAVLTLDLVDRPGKYENGFMHGPGLAYLEHGSWRPARINFTANAVVGQVGSGLSATRTLFHEGGHAAHFANIQAEAPCFSHEFAPTSVTYAETQSMFMDSLLEDADWRTRYARDGSGKPMPWELIEASVREGQPFRGWDVRAMLTVPFAERALYEIPDDRLSPETVLEKFRTIERDLQGLTAGARPVLAVPHLLAGESSAYYHAYVLAEMAVYQTRQFFLDRDGHLTDNPRIGPELAKHYWAPGNAAAFDDLLRDLTGEPLQADALVAACNRTVDEAVAEARQAADRVSDKAERRGPVDLGGTIRVVHGTEEVASTEAVGFDEACSAFSNWILSLESQVPS